jgi:hypothetical protein
VLNDLRHTPQGGSHRMDTHGRQQAPKRQHGLDAFACSHDVGGDTKTNAVAEEVTHGAPRGRDRRFG